MTLSQRIILIFILKNCFSMQKKIYRILVAHFYLVKSINHLLMIYAKELPLSCSVLLVFSASFNN